MRPAFGPPSPGRQVHCMDTSQSGSQMQSGTHKFLVQMLSFHDNPEQVNIKLTQIKAVAS